MRWLSLIVLAIFLGSSTVADAQVFKPRGKGTKSTKATAKKPAAAAAKTGAATKRSTKPTTKTAAKTTAKPVKKGKASSARPSDLTPDPVDADEDYVVIEDLDDDE